MSTSLYRTYRPQTFGEVVGQNHIKITIQNQLKRGTVAHAYLFAGPRGVGKTTSARLLAKALNCQKRTADSAEPCNDCPACTEITAGNSLDVLEIDAASNTGVDNVRETIIETARFTPSRWAYKVFIIDEVHMLSTAAFNALLKVLEEPPAHVVFILCTTELHKIPGTIISRCQRFDFRRVGVADMTAHLQLICQAEKVQCEPAVLQSIARHAEGYLRDAVGLLGQVLALGEKKITTEQSELVIPRSYLESVIAVTQAIADRAPAAGLTVVNRLVDDGAHLPQFTRELVEFWRKVLFAVIAQNLAEFTADVGGDAATLERLTQTLSADRLVTMIETVLRHSAVRSSPLPQLPLELSIIELCGDTADGAGTPPPPAPRTGGAPPSTPATPTPPPPAKTSRSQTSKPKTSQVESAATVVSATPVVAETPAATPVIALETVLERWLEGLVALDAVSHSLSLILSVARPVSVAGNVITVGVGYSLHQETVNQPKNRLTVGEVFSTLLGVPVSIEAIVVPSVEPVSQPAPRDAAPVSSDEAIATVLEVFGGGVVGEVS